MDLQMALGRGRFIKRPAGTHCEEARSPFVKKYKTVIHPGECSLLVRIIFVNNTVACVEHAQYNIDQALQKDSSFRRWVLPQSIGAMKLYLRQLVDV
uniref:Uncharacterized protein n=1 Tax=Cucumis melo TaxID=3656 RepID=A0A9I9E8G6_CUCME